MSRSDSSQHRLALIEPQVDLRAEVHSLGPQEYEQKPQLAHHRQDVARAAGLLDPPSRVRGFCIALRTLADPLRSSFVVTVKAAQIAGGGEMLPLRRRARALTARQRAMASESALASLDAPRSATMSPTRMPGP